MQVAASPAVVTGKVTAVQHMPVSRPANVVLYKGRTVSSIYSAADFKFNLGTEPRVHQETSVTGDP
jgi:hypothetical protein